MYYFDEPHLSREEKTLNREKEIFNIILNYSAKHKRPPTVREIARLSSLSSTSTISKYLHKLKDKGYIDWMPMHPRSITILKEEY